VALQWALAGNIVIALAYAAITVAITVPVLRAGQLRSNRLAVATALIFFSCSVGHALHAVMYWRASVDHATIPGMHLLSGWSLWPTAVLTAAVGIFYWTLRRGYGILLSGTGALFVDPHEQQRRHDIEMRERVAEGRAQAEAERDAQQAMLSAVVSNSQSMVYVKDLEGRYLLVNEAFQAAFGVTEAELLGQSDDYIDPAQAPVWQANDRLAHTGAVHMEETALIDGRQRVYETNKFPLSDAAGELYASCGISLDVTDLRRAAVVAEQARDEALSQSRIKSEFLATMSHEIRTPMNGVLGLATLLIRSELSPAQRRYADGIHSAGSALLTVINDILDISKIEAGQVLLDPADINLPELLDATVALIGPVAQAKGLVVRVRCGTGLPTAVRGDGGRVRQILLNLTGNAVKFTAQGSVTLRADLVGADRPTVRFEVIDTGIGIASGDAERLFEPFTQADASTTRKYGGTGLGLAISRQLTEAMGGTIGVTSEPGQGSTFWCEIPFEPAQGAAAAPAADDTPVPAGRGTVLLVEDNDTNQLVALGLLTGLGYRADVAGDGLQACEMTAAGHYDAILMDCLMPGMDGFTATARLRDREHEDGTRTPIIAMTASALAADRQRCLAAGMDDYLAKPVDPAELAHALDRWLLGDPSVPNRG
jgi:PAS domain S-box-containing protein